jgi:hypothetical protein
MSKSRKIEEQKGPIVAHQQTMRQMTYPQKCQQQREEDALRRSGQTLTLHVPKTGK